MTTERTNHKNKRVQNRRKSNVVSPVKARVKKVGFWLTMAIAASVLGVTLAFAGTHLVGGVNSVTNRPVAAIEIDSELNRVTMQELQTVLEPLVDKPFLSIDLNYVKERLEQHPWVAEVSLNRQWPDKLHVQLIEEVAIARWQDNSFLNQAGEKIELGNNKELSNLPQLLGPVGSEQTVARKFVEINLLLKPLSLTVWQLALSDELAWQLELDNGLVLTLGRDQLAEKIERFVSVYQNALATRITDIQAVDLRYRNGLAVQWQTQALTATGK